ncbi:tetratricopeptide repeat protein [Tenacibaculum sp. M341]|uniref:tetratricopeptide repeat protein n=1 Tax=Tenacibaculum sp. M341 TaxID=2530339 RepID=UPI00104BA773|nr:tetratricopeptide repeat protein [Tenacibaculum sp. M341]TCI90202.1 hypothetical protein EYW44_14815 [Tenacibaculum sp. M341]
MDNNIERFLNDQMDAKERALFLQEMSTNPELKETVELYQDMQTLYSEDDWKLEDATTKNTKIQESLAFLRSEEGEHIKKAIAKGADSYFAQEAKAPKIRKLILVASSIAAMLLIGLFVFNTSETNTELYASYKNDWQELPSLTLRGDTNDFSRIESLFKQQKYTESLALLEKFKEEKTDDPQILMYEGVLNLELNQQEKAIQIFNELIQKDTLDSYKAHWYLALSYLKSDNTKQAKKELQFIINDGKNFKDKEAKELLSKLE